MTIQARRGVLHWPVTVFRSLRRPENVLPQQNRPVAQHSHASTLQTAGSPPRRLNCHPAGIRRHQSSAIDNRTAITRITVASVHSRMFMNKGEHGSCPATTPQECFVQQAPFPKWRGLKASGGCESPDWRGRNTGNQGTDVPRSPNEFLKSTPLTRHDRA